MEDIRIKVFIEPWDKELVEDCSDPDGFETSIRITKEDIENSCEIMGLNRDGKISLDEIMEDLQETIMQKIEESDILPTEYCGNFTWDYVGKEYKKVEEFAKPIIQKCETEIIRERYENYFQSWTHAEFVEEKNVDGIDYVYYRVRKDEIM